MNDDQLNSFIQVADCGSFTKAEELCHISKQALLKQMNSLEQEVGCALLYRKRTGIELTEAGKLFYQGAKRLLQSKDNLIRRCRDTVRNNVIRIGAVEHQVLLNPVTEAFRAMYPAIRVERVVHPNHSGEYRVANGIMDVGETFLSDQNPAHTGFSFTKLTEVPYCAAMDPHHPLAQRKTVRLNELASYETVIMPIMLMKEYTKAIEEAFSAHPGNLIESGEVDHQVETAFSCIHTKRILITANPFIESVKELVKVPLETGWKRAYGIIYLSPANDTVQKFIDLAVEIYSER